MLWIKAVVVPKQAIEKNWISIIELSKYLYFHPTHLFICFKNKQIVSYTT